MCICYSSGMFSVCVLCVFLVRRRGRRRLRHGGGSGSGGGKWQRRAQVGKVETVSKTLFFVVKCGSKIIAVTISYFDSNYDRWYYRKRFHIPSNSSLDPEGHTYGPEDPWPCPSGVSDIDVKWH